LVTWYLNLLCMVILVGSIFRFDLWLLLLHDHRTRFSICTTMNVMVSIEFLMYLTIAIYNMRGNLGMI
jgi:hypothetical protein